MSGVVDVTTKLRRQARYRAAKVLAAAGWSWRDIALALGVSRGAVVKMIPEEAKAQVETLWHPPASD